MPNDTTFNSMQGTALSSTRVDSSSNTVTLLGKTGAVTINGSASGLSVAVDYFEVLAFQTSGNALTVANVGNYTSEFSMVRVGP